MTVLGVHIRTRLEDNRVIASSAEHRRLVARVVLKQGREDGLIAFSLPDTHLHLAALCSLAAASRLSQRITSSLKQRLSLPVSFVTYPHKPVHDQQHLYSTQRYVLTQHERHGVDGPAILEGTNLPDLLGLRTLGRYTRDNVQRYLPRVRKAMLLEWAGLTDLVPADGPIFDIVEATLAASGLPGLVGNSRPVVEARCALLEVAGATLGCDQAARMLGVSTRTVYTLRHRQPDPALVNAIRLQLGLRKLLRAQQACAG